MTGEDDASDFVDAALEVIQSAGSWAHPGFLYFKVLIGYLKYSSFLTKGKNRHFK